MVLRELRSVDLRQLVVKNKPTNNNSMSHDSVIHETDGRKWIDEKHEEDGTQPEHIETNFDEHDQHSGSDEQAVIG